MSYNVFGGTLNLTQPNITLTLTVTVTVHFYFAFYNNSPIVHSTVSERCECCRPAHKFQFRRDAAATENAPLPNRRPVRGRKRLPLLEARNDERDGVQWRHYVSPVAATEGVAPIFTALHGIQSRYSDGNSVCLSVCPSVKRVHCDKTEEKSVQLFIP